MSSLATDNRILTFIDRRHFYFSWIQFERSFSTALLLTPTILFMCYYLSHKRAQKLVMCCMMLLQTNFRQFWEAKSQTGITQHFLEGYFYCPNQWLIRYTWATLYNQTILPLFLISEIGKTRSNFLLSVLKQYLSIIYRPVIDFPNIVWQRSLRMANKLTYLYVLARLPF